MDNLVTVITNVGFPIFCVLALGYFIYTYNETITKDNKERENKLYEIISMCQNQLNDFANTNSNFINVLNELQEDSKNMRADVDDIKDSIGSIKNEN